MFSGSANVANINHHSFNSDFPWGGRGRLTTFIRDPDSPSQTNSSFLDLRTPAVSPSTAFEPPLLKRDDVELAKVVVAAALSADAAAAPRCGAFFCRLGAW